MAMMPEEVIFAIVLVDLPADVDDKGGVKVRQGLGDSWWFLACESDDHYFEIVQEVVGVKVPFFVNSSVTICWSV
jgi:hypothetical protein